SRWSSKLVHGGLRYLASGRVGIAWESAVERHVLMTAVAPHLVRPLVGVVPILPSMRWYEREMVRAGYLAADTPRPAAGPPPTPPPRARRVPRDAVLHLVPGVRTDGLRGGYVAWDGQLIDDARLVVAVVRTAAELGATALAHVRACDVTGTS